MKLLFLILVFSPLISIGQQVKNLNSDQTVELKKVAGNYCIVGISQISPNIVQIQTDNDTWDFLNPENREKLKFKTAVAMLNYMENNGWKYVSVYVDKLQFFVFRKN